MKTKTEMEEFIMGQRREEMRETKETKEMKMTQVSNDNTDIRHPDKGAPTTAPAPAPVPQVAKATTHYIFGPREKSRQTSSIHFKNGTWHTPTRDQHASTQTNH